MMRPFEPVIIVGVLVVSAGLAGCGSGSSATTTATATVTVTATAEPKPESEPEPFSSASESREMQPTVASSPTRPSASADVPEDCFTAEDFSTCVFLWPTYVGRDWEVLLKNPDKYIGLKTVMFVELSGSSDLKDYDGGTGQPGREGVWGFASPTNECPQFMSQWDVSVVVGLFGDKASFVRQVADDDILMVRGTFVGSGEIGFDKSPYFEVDEWRLVPEVCSG
jgi:hypothetical protein